MIALNKTAIPRLLEENSAQWTETLLEKQRRGEAPTAAELSRYNHPAIKAALLAETHEKCAYCESKVRHVAFGDVEHIVPKSVVPEQRFAWENLTIACDVCNTRKGNREGFLDPYRDVPDEHLTFEGPVLLPRPESALGLFTETTLELNRMPLVERRRDRLMELHRLIILAETHADAATRAALRDDILRNGVSVEREYAGMCRVVVARQLPAPAGT